MDHHKEIQNVYLPFNQYLLVFYNYHPALITEVGGIRGLDKVDSWPSNKSQLTLDWTVYWSNYLLSSHERAGLIGDPRVARCQSNTSLLVQLHTSTD